MPATPRSVGFQEGDDQPRLSYADLENGDYEATLLDVIDVEASTGNYGWGFQFQVKGLTLTTKTWLKGGGGWKVREVFNALGMPLPPGTDTKTLDPNILIGRKCVVTVQRKPYSNGALNDDGTPKTFVEITRHTPFVAEPVADFGDL